MYQTDINQYLEQFFCSTNCEILNKSDTELTVKLTPEMDEQLMNRPFYWSYIKKVGGIPNPMTVTYYTNPTEQASPNSDFVHFGSPKLHQIFQVAKQLGAYFKLFQDISMNQSNQQKPLHPWLMQFLLISYESNQKKQVFQSIGLNLINGAIVEHIDQMIDFSQLTDAMPDYCFTITPIIKPESGLERIEAYIENKIKAEVHTWAEEARVRLKEDVQLLEQFYLDFEEKPESYWHEFSAIHSQFEPKITIQIVSGGLVYLTPNVHE